MTFYTYTLGCKVNSYESSAVASKLMSDGFIYSEDNPDVIIINTCSVTHVADQKSRQHIRKFRKLYPHAIIVAMGCFAQGNADFIKNECGADIVIGTSKRNELSSLINEYITNHKQIMDVASNPRCYQYEELGIASYSENIRAYLKIQDGCDNFCSYCIVPYRRGKARSRDFNQIVKEANELVLKGYKEIVLTGIHVGMYGKDIGTSFSNLVEELTKIDDLFRIRISSIEESEIDDKLIFLFSKYCNLARHLHMPMQSGCEKTLKAMGRKYNVNDFIKKVERIREVCPRIAITTDVIVGFPGETDEDFLKTVDFIKTVNFSELHVFPFSARENTKAYSMPNQVDPKIKASRVDTLIKLSEELSKKYYDSFKGEELEVILEERNKFTKLLSGFSSNYLKLSADYPDSYIGKIVKIKVE